MRIETFRTIIVAASVITEARALAASFPGGAVGAGTYTGGAGAPGVILLEY